MSEEGCVHVMEEGWSVNEVVQDIVQSGEQEDPFFVMNVGEVVDRHRVWRQLMPRVEPFYAVKCNDDKVLLRTLAALGTGFDCASRQEIELVTSLGVAPERIVFASPTKMVSHMKHAVAVGVNITTFDCAEELYKSKKHMPHAQLLLRVRCDATAAQCPLGNKFGCEPADAPRLLELAASLGLDVAGVSFHVGSNAREVSVFERGIRLCAALFLRAAALGLRPRLVDLGGGFPGDSYADMHRIAAVINSALQTHFPDPAVRVVAEPGRYFAAAAYTLATCVFAKRTLAAPEGDEAHTMYFLNDGVYSAFKDCALYALTVSPTLLNLSSKTPLPCSLWGPTLDGIDCISPATRLPPLSVGSWLLFPNMGAYTIPGSGVFNGFPLPKPRAYIDKDLWLKLKDKQPFSEAKFVHEHPADKTSLTTNQWNDSPTSRTDSQDQHRRISLIQKWQHLVA